MEMNHTYKSSDFGVDFGQAVDTPQGICYVKILDMNDQQLRIPYISQTVTIKKLIETYKKISSCNSHFKNKPVFKILSGPLKDNIASENYILSNLGLSQQEYCFAVQDLKNQEIQSSLIKTQSQKSKMFAKDNFNVFIIYNNDKIAFEINKNETIKAIKMKLLMSIQNIKNQSIQNIKLQCDGFFLVDNQKVSENGHLKQNCSIKLYINIKSGCFHPSTQITTPSGVITIDKLKYNDQIISFNLQTKSYQIDQITNSQSCRINQAIFIVLQDGNQIITTLNHLFLCEDLIFRKIQYDQNNPIETLKVGMSLKYADKSIKIISIETKQLPQYVDFYHLSILKNHNFIVNNAIAHNMYVDIKLPDNKIERLNVDPSTTILSIKQSIEKMYYVHCYHQKLLFTCNELSNSSSISDYNIIKQSVLTLKYPNKNMSNLIHPETKILLSSGQQIKAQNLKEGDKIAIYNQNSRFMFEKPDIVQSIEFVNNKEYISLDLKEIGNCSKFGADTYIQLKNNSVVNLREVIQYDIDQEQKVKMYDEEYQIIKSVAHDTYSKPFKYIRLVLKNNGDFIANGIVIRNSFVNIYDSVRNKRLRFACSLKANIEQIKKRVYELTNLALENQQFVFNGKVLQNNQKLDELGIGPEHTILLNFNQINVNKSSISFIPGQKSEKIVKKTIYLQVSSTEKIEIEYNQYCSLTVQQIMKQFYPNYKSSYFFLFAEFILLPQDTLDKIGQSPQFQQQNHNILVVKNQKYAFIQNISIQKSQIKTYGSLIYNSTIQPPEQTLSQILVNKSPQIINSWNNAENRIRGSEDILPVFKTHKFYTPFLYYTSRKYDEAINQYIRNFEKHASELNANESIYKLIKDLYINMNLLQNYIGNCYRGIRNFRISLIFQPGNTFYWHSFTSTRADNNKIVAELKGNQGTLFNIKSISGKDIRKYSINPEQKQILFLPFTYFLIEKIQVKQFYDEVWVSQVPSPVTFQQNIILWVDDQPKNNIKEINTILHSHQIQILQVTSTILAEKWVKQFGWLVNWKGLKFKLISDMTRVEGPKQTNNYEAGIDLLQILYNKYGITAPTLIFCGNKTRGQQNIKKRGIRKDRIYKVTEKGDDVYNFAQFEN